MEFNLVTLLLLTLPVANVQTLEDWTVSAEVGGTVILPVNLNLTEDSELSEPWIKWMNERGGIVHEYWAIEDYNENQDEHFKGRTSLFMEEINKGNVSLKIRDITISDAGIYICEVRHNLFSPPERFYVSMYWTVTVEEGATVILPVKVDLPENSKLLNTTIKWWTEGKNIVVHQYRRNKDYNEDQDERFKGRTSLFEEEIKRGDFSLMIWDVTKNDEGNYTYEVHHQNPKLKKTGIVSLYVTKKREDPIPNLKHPSKTWGQIIGVVFTVPFALALVALRVYLYTKCRQAFRRTESVTYIIVQ